MTPTRAHCFAVLSAATKPRDRLTVSTWADRHRMLSSKQSGERGKWRTERNPILREIQDSLSVFSPVREIVVMSFIADSSPEKLVMLHNSFCKRSIQVFDCCAMSGTG